MHITSGRYLEIALDRVLWKKGGKWIRDSGDTSSGGVVMVRNILQMIQIIFGRNIGSSLLHSWVLNLRGFLSCILSKLGDNLREFHKKY